MNHQTHIGSEPAVKGRLRNIYWLLMLFSMLLFGTFLTFIVWQNIKTAEDEFKQYGHQVHQSLVQSFSVNETILDGFAAFLADVGMQDPNRARFYTRTMIERYSHLYMFQAAQRVKGIDVPVFEKNLSVTLDEPINVRRFEFGEGLMPADVNSHRDYYPLVFVEPVFQDGLNILGLDISSIQFIKQAMEHALSSGLANLSQPIELSDGSQAFVMIKPSFLPGQEVADQYALLVVKTTALLTNLRPREAGYGLTLVYPQHDPILDLTTAAVTPWQLSLFPLLVQDSQIKVGAQNIQLTLTRQLSLKQINLFLITIVFLVTLAISVLLHLYMRIQFEADLLKQEANQKLYQQANYDHLTGLANRHYFEDHFHRAAARCQRRKNKMALLYIDLDDFKYINDELGHQMGDNILSLAASIITDTIRVDDVPCRFGGDEFVVLLENISVAEDVKRVVRNLHATFGQVKVLDGHSVKLSASIGDSMFPDDGLELAALMKYADRKMYAQKNQNKVVKLPAHKQPAE